MKEFYSFSHTNIGYSHIESGKVCQDFSDCYNDDDMTIIVVSDGHGSSNFPRSDRGSKYACEVSIEAAKSFAEGASLKDLGDARRRDDMINQMCKFIIKLWNDSVCKDYEKEKFTEEEVAKVSEKYHDKYLIGESIEHAYGCTLILVIVTKNYWIGIRNGDGECVMVNRDGAFSKPIPWNDNCNFNVTTSLCDYETIREFRYFYSEDLPAAVMIGSDGVDDSYTSEDEFYNLYRTLCFEVIEEGVESGSKKIESFLPILTKCGSGDDVSIAAFFNMPYLSEAEHGIRVAQKAYDKKVENNELEKKKSLCEYNIKTARKKSTKAQQEKDEIQQRLSLISGKKNDLFLKIGFYKSKCSELENNEKSLIRRMEELNRIIDESAKEIENNEIDIEKIKQLQSEADTPVIENVVKFDIVSDQDEVASNPDDSETFSSHYDEAGVLGENTADELEKQSNDAEKGTEELSDNEENNEWGDSTQNDSNWSGGFQ